MIDRYIRVRFNVAVGNYGAGLMYDVVNNTSIRKLINAGICEQIPYKTVTPEEIED